MNEKVLNISKKKLYVIIALLVLLLVGGTYAVLTLAINVTNGLYNVTATCFDINYDSGEDITGTLFPSANPQGGLTGSVSIGIDEDCNVNAVGNLYLNINNNSSSILTQVVEPHCEDSRTLETLDKYKTETACTSQDNAMWVTDGTALKYAVYKGNEVVSVGYIDTMGDSINVYEEFRVLSNLTQYDIYVWLDGHISDNSYQNLSFGGNISAEVIQKEGSFVNKPVLDEGMIPVTISADGVATTVSEDNSSWYNYDNKEWANVVLVNKDATANVIGSHSREYYKNNPGTPVVESDILAYYVWIPRYKYRIPEMTCSELGETSTFANPECYDAPYMMSEDDKTLLIEWWYDYGYCEDILGDCTEEINLALQNGEIYEEIDDYVYSLSELVEWCNTEYILLITYTGKFNGNAIVTGPRPIDISFETTTSSIISGDAVNTFRTHPAFIWNGKNVSGIWVGKFETGHSSLSSSTTDNNLGCSDENCANADGLIIKPNVISLTSNNISNFFYANRSITRSSNPFGLSALTTDSHMMKNSEWGAVAYLSHSKYGLNKEIYENNSSDPYTGRSKGKVASNDEEFATFGLYTWVGQEIDSSGTIGNYAADRTLGTNASTTGNVTGIYDMSGGANELVMGFLSDPDGNPRSGYTSKWNSGFTGLLSDGTTYAGLSFPLSKYYDLYTTVDFTTACNGSVCYGHALSETSKWYSDKHIFVYLSQPILRRGSHNGFEIGAFSFYSGYGNDGASRSVLVVD